MTYLLKTYKIDEQFFLIEYYNRKENVIIIEYLYIIPFYDGSRYALSWFENDK